VVVLGYIELIIYYHMIYLLENGNDKTPSTSYTTTLSENTFYRPRFSLLELIVVVISTFSIILELFIDSTGE